MDEKKMGQYLKEEQQRLNEERAATSWKKDPIYQQNQRMEENRRMIDEKRLTLGKRVRLPLLGMEGVVTGITDSDTIPVEVQRDDGQVFGYAPGEVEVVE